ncbi:hypothetical protein CRUP_019673, partial [Coryphaenoides rupestris]
ICVLLFTCLYVLSYLILKHFKKKAEFITDQLLYITTRRRRSCWVEGGGEGGPPVVRSAGTRVSDNPAPPHVISHRLKSRHVLRSSSQEGKGVLRMLPVANIVHRLLR